MLALMNILIMINIIIIIMFISIITTIIITTIIIVIELRAPLAPAAHSAEGGRAMATDSWEWGGRSSCGLCISGGTTCLTLLV